MNLSLQVFCDASKSSYARQNFRLPIILPSNHPVVKALIIYKHVQLGHAEVQMLMYTLRETYWILKGRKTIKEVIKTCIICKRFNAKPISVSEELLPQDRVRDAAIFEIIGLYLAGPLILKNGVKNWILILTCAVYRAIHLELLTSVSTESFLLGLSRFIARRGRPSVIYSDNGTNFKGAYRLYQKVNLEKLKNVEELNLISWKFIPPQDPWWGGFWERLIVPVKRTLRKTPGKTSLNHEEMYTVLCDCESLINSRPLTYVTDDVEDLEPLTPAMFLQDISEVGVPELDQIDENELNKILVYRNRIQKDLRKRFRVEYLGQLRETRNIKGGNTLS
ncbi:integrase catalytic domain-containing protein [Trichonephila clavipes]|nr:integrase catalytic domain-containing protein [Trichonephila clavipes]